ncbi:hypothetical protein BGW38_003202 [Lunasporangiospora selenospora]|uniref:(d)CMP kinase n=1 Tax=Lunasporangiospora selenospora TaxID=979761 RepID=A0A9P6G428_9FUNG|nr:hypothetical protein BGW38_003202 [Lunasporangiospora selenospora]
MLAQTLRAYSTAARRRPFQVAIDGPAASGKSTTAKMVAQRLGFDYIDTGAFYRCVTLAAMSKNLDPSDPSNVQKISDLAFQSRIGLKTIFADPVLNADKTLSTPASLPTTRVFLDSKDVSLEIRTGSISKHVSAVAAIGPVREAVLQKVREIGAREDTGDNHGSDSSSAGLVMDGRDIGTVVLPKADLKVFLVADSRVRAMRRLEELIRNGADPSKENLDLDVVQQDLERRDELDRTRKVSPLRKAADAMELDTSNLTIEGQVDEIVKEVEKRRGVPTQH